ncbi:MAG TPA: aromatic amino acid ammonia-lyase [Gammaproteobacteria bacterium]|nr:aromatic amino acid ammonia-lyase [Gammaproteobacteria bacterium]
MFGIDEKIKAKTPAKKTIVSIGPTCKLTLSDAKKVGIELFDVHLSENAYADMERSHAFLQNHVDKRVPIYGINTQFGDQVTLLDENLKNPDATLYYGSIKNRQTNLIKSLACGMGDAVSTEIVRVAMLLRAQCLSQGYSGVSPSVVQSIIASLNSGIVPIVPKHGSIGASGDLIPLATIAAALIGDNINVQYQDTIMPAANALKLAGLNPIKLEMRDGLAMINGTSFMTAIASISLCHLNRLFKQMLASIAMMLESLIVITSAYDPLVHQLKRQSGQIEINHFLLSFWKGSQLLFNLDELRTQNAATANPSYEHATKPVQDYYSIRSVAQGFGPFQENLQKAIVWIENEMNAVNDNPIINALGEKIYHSANFMGYYVTDACDILKMNIGQASTWLHALLANLVHPRKNHHLPANLVEHPEKYNGFKSMQLLAAALAVQNRKLAQSHQSFSIPTEGDNQDVNSLGTHAALDFCESVENLERLTAIMFLASVQALEFRGIKKASPRAQNIYHIIRKQSPTVVCRVMQHELNDVVSLLRAEKI